MAGGNATSRNGINFTGKRPFSEVTKAREVPNNATALSSGAQIRRQTQLCVPRKRSATALRCEVESSVERSDNRSLTSSRLSVEVVQT